MAETEQLGQARGPGAAGQPYSILLVEDDNVTLKAVEAILRIHGHYRVTTAMSVAQALQHVSDAREKGQLFDMILTDLCLPEVSGLQLIQEITDIPVVVMSCQDSQASVLQCFEAGAAGYLIKPIRKNEVSTLWQHIWRNNRCKVTSHVAAAAAAAPGNDSGMSACTDMVGQQSSEPFPTTAPMAEATTPGSAQPSAPEEAVMPSEAPSSASKPSGPPGLALHVQPLPGAGIAAIHVDLPISSVSTVAASVRTLASSQLGASVGAAPALLTVGAQACAAEPSSGDDVPPCSTSPVVVAEGSNDPSGCSSGGGSEVTFALASSSQAYNVRAPQPLSRPMATSTGASQPGRIRHLPPGLQELAALGQQRQQQEAGPNTAAAQQPQQQVPDETALEHGGLNHSFGSAFTAVTVFLPRSAAALPGSAAQGAGAGSAAAALKAEPGSDEQGAAQQQQQVAGQDAAESAIASREPSARSEPSSTQPAAATAGGGLTVGGLAAAALSAVASGAAEAKAAASAPQLSAVSAPATSLLPGNAPALWASTLPALQPLMACHMPATAHGQAAAMGQVHYLPQSVLQLICALSTPGGAGVMGAPGAPGVLSPHNRVPGAPSVDGAQSKATHRQQAVAKYLEKRKMRTFEKKVRYESRKRLAESRPRVKGQFVKSSVLAAAKAAEAAQAHPGADAAGQRHAAAKGSSESDAAEVLAGLADIPVGSKRCRTEPAHEVESEDDAMSDTEP